MRTRERVAQGSPLFMPHNYSEGSIPPGVFVNIVHSCGAKSYKACYWSSSNCFIVYGKISQIFKINGFDLDFSVENCNIDSAQHLVCNQRFKHNIWRDLKE